MEGSIIVELLKDVALPAATAVVGWFASVWRTRQKKEADVLENVTQILAMQKQYIAEQDDENKKTREINKRLERKLDDMRRSIIQANWCKFTNEGDGCPVLNHEKKTEGEGCDSCEYYQRKNDNGKA